MLIGENKFFKIKVYMVLCKTIKVENVAQKGNNFNYMINQLNVKCKRQDFFQKKAKIKGGGCSKKYSKIHNFNI